MEILTALKFLLVVGILNSAVAQAEHPVVSSMDRIYRDSQAMLNFFLFMGDNTYSFDETVVKAKAKCNKNGGATAYDTAVQNLRDLENPLSTLINATDNSIKSVVSDASSPQQHKNIQTVCFKALTLKEWVTISRGAITPCFNPDERQFLELVVNVSFPVIEYICENNASRILGK
ncbi:uncharacterized protein LOC124408697 [Diprion similis]|uniref:uncharacterized protein LOC124408697 n=1 Tax=Diprion similis TaxID=362088 RepID=UPI001EF92BFF|nr:uncharacterized protein LOC124408697 [Diprion similis]